VPDAHAAEPMHRFANFTSKRRLYAETKDAVSSPAITQWVVTTGTVHKGPCLEVPLAKLDGHL